MVIDVSGYLFPYDNYSELSRSEGWILEDSEGNGVPNPSRRSSWCWLAEEYAANFLNSGSLHPWKMDFIVDRRTEMWDLINSEGMTIEVKSTQIESEFRRTSVRLNLPEQEESLIMKLFHGNFGFESLKFVMKTERGWGDVSDAFRRQRWPPSATDNVALGSAE